MSFYDDASIVMIPSGYKAGKLYCAKPTDGSGDLSFTRTGATATRVNESGLVERCRTNQLVRSEEFDNASWAKYQSTITANSVVSPIGTLTADTFTDNSVNDNHLISQSFVFSISSTIVSVYAKANTLSHIRLTIYDGVSFIDSGIFNLSNGTVSGNGSILSAGDGWYRCSFSFIPSSTNGFVYIFTSNGSTTVYSGTGKSIYIWGAQVELGDIATAYIPTTSTAVTVGPIANVPRLDYTGGGCPKLLMEPTRMNRSIYSEQFNNAAYTLQAGTLTANNTTSPDGYQNADLFLETSATSSHSIGCPIITTGLYTAAQSVFVKNAPNGRGFVQLTGAAIWNGTGNNFYVNFDIINGTVTASNGATGSIINYGNGWFRCIAVSTCIIEYEDRLRIRSITNGAAAYAQSFAGDITKGFYVYGSTFEQGAYATSYIPTFNASVTRNADNATKASATALIGQTEGTIYFEGIVSDFASTNFGVWGVQNAATSSHIHIASGNNDLFVQSYNGTTSLFFTTLSYIKGTLVKIALAYKAGDYAVYKNGTLILSGTNATAVPICDRIETNRLWLSPGDQRELINQGLIFKTRLSNSDLATLTTL